MLAVDGGNTKTIALAVRGDGQVLGQSRGGCSDLYNADSPETALAVLEATAAAALGEAGVGGSEVAAAVFSLAGADWPEDFALLEAELPRRLGLEADPLVVNDALGALRGGAPDWAGIAVVCGTYGAIAARRADGRLFHLGFWPDSAGGRQLGGDGLRAVYRAALGLGPPTSLTELALARFGSPDPVELLHAFTRRGGRPESDEDLLAPDVLDAAEDADPVALELVHGQARVMGAEARAAAAAIELPLDGSTVVLSGGVLTHPSPLLADLIMAELPGARRARTVHPPVVGAALLALDRLGVAADGAQVAAGLRVPLTPGRSAPWAGSRSIA